MSILGYVFIVFMFALMLAMARELRMTLKEFRIMHEEMKEMHKACCPCMCETKKDEKDKPIARTPSPKTPTHS